MPLFFKRNQTHPKSGELSDFIPGTILFVRSFDDDKCWEGQEPTLLGCNVMVTTNKLVPVVVLDGNKDHKDGQLIGPKELHPYSFEAVRNGSTFEVDNNE